MTHLDLFSGIGGFALALESTGLYRTVAFCEIEPFPRRVLAKHWPDIPCYEDVRNVTADRLFSDGIGRIDVITGGFPCQDISLAGARAGLSGERSGLWSELLRVVVEVAPRWVIAENVPGLRTLGADAVLADLARAGYAAWALVVGAVHAGAPHRRKRVWIVAHSKRNDLRQEQGRAEPGWTGTAEPGDDGEGWYAAHAQGIGRTTEGQRGQQEESGIGLEKREGQRENAREEQSTALRSGGAQWNWSLAPEPVICRVDDGLPCGMDRRERLKALGNAVVPQVAASLGRAIPWRYLD